MARDPSPAEGWQFWSMRGDAANHHQENSPTSTSHLKTAVYPKQQQDELKIPIPSSDGLMKKDAWQFWALGDLSNNSDNDEEQPSASVPLMDATNTAPKKGWKYWAIGGSEDRDHRDPSSSFLSENSNHDQPPAVELEPQDSREDECAWRYWAQVQQHREEPKRRRSSEFDSKEAWQFWAIGVLDNASTISLLTEGFEIESNTPTMVKIVKIKPFMPPIESLDAEMDGWRYWSTSSMEKDAALKKSHENKSKQGWQFWAIGGANKASMVQEFIASERFQAEPDAPLVKPVAPNMSDSPKESAGGKYWSHVEEIGTGTAKSKKGWQFWAIGAPNQHSETRSALAGLHCDSSVKTTTRSQNLDSSSKIRSQEIRTEGSDSVHASKKNGWQFWALGVSNQSLTDRSSLLSLSDIDEPLASNSSSREPTGDEGGWRYWSRMKLDNREDLLQRHENSKSFSPFPTIPVPSAGKRAKFSAKPKFYSLKSSNSLSRIEEEERASKDDVSCDEVLEPIEGSPSGKETLDTAVSSHSEGSKPNGKEDDNRIIESTSPHETTRTLLAAEEEAEEPIPKAETKTPTSIQKEPSNALQNLKKSLNFEAQKEKLFASDQELRSNKPTSNDWDPVIPKRGILPKDWIHQPPVLRKRRGCKPSQETQEHRYHQEAARLYAQAQERKRQVAAQVKDDLIEFEDVVIRGIAITATHAVDVVQYAVSTCFRSKPKDDGEEVIEFTTTKQKLD